MVFYTSCFQIAPIAISLSYVCSHLHWFLLLHLPLAQENSTVHVHTSIVWSQNKTVPKHAASNTLHGLIWESNDWSAPDCPNKLQNLLDALGKQCKDNQMMINHDKTKLYISDIQKESLSL